MEQLDLCDERGRPLSRGKARGLVHRDGDWHRAFHCWVVVSGELGGGQAPTLRAERAHLLLQRRSLQKETWPGLWDVSVGGHYQAGEGIEGGLREIQEELGLTVQADELAHAGWRREEVLHENGIIEREIQDVFFLRRSLRLGDLHPDPAEVSAVALVPAAALGPLSAGRLESIEVSGAEAGGSEGVFRLRPRELVPRAGDYYGKVGRFARRRAELRGSVRRRWW